MRPENPRNSDCAGRQLPTYECPGPTCSCRQTDSAIHVAYALHKAGVPTENLPEVMDAAHDLAAVNLLTFDAACRAIVAAMDESEPLKTYGVVTKRRWYERPLWLWRRHIQHRIYRLLDEEQDD